MIIIFFFINTTGLTKIYTNLNTLSRHDALPICMLLVSHYNYLPRVEGMNVYNSVIKGSLDRLNPIIMTALSSALALIPLAIAGDQPGNEIQSPMAKVILGGLLTSTFLNGFIIPIVYLLIHRKNISVETHTVVINPEKQTES